MFAYEGGPCYRCLYPEPPPPGLVPSCAEGGVLGIGSSDVSTWERETIQSIADALGAHATDAH